MRREKNPKYIAAGAHEYGHAQIAAKSKYPKARAVSNALGGFSDVAGLGIGALAQHKFGRLGASILGGAVSGAAHVPLLIEEHSASKRALKAMKASGELSPEEYTEAEQTLGRAYKTYVNRALGASATSAAALSGHVGLLSAGVSTRGLSQKDAVNLLKQIRGNEADARRVRGLGDKMGQRKVRQVYGASPTYVAPYEHVRPFYKRRAQYLRALNKAGLPVSARDLKHGAVTLPHYEKYAAPITVPGVTNVAKAAKSPLSRVATRVRHGVEDAFNFTSDGPYTQARRFLGRYVKNPDNFRGNVNTYVTGKAMDVANAVNTSPALGVVKQVADDALNILT